MATSPSNRSVSQAPQSLRQVRFPSLRKELLRLESGQTLRWRFGWRALATVRRVLAIARAVKPGRLVITCSATGFTVEITRGADKWAVRASRRRCRRGVCWAHHEANRAQRASRLDAAGTPLCAPRNPGPACPLSGDNPTRSGAPRYHVSAPSLTRFGSSQARSPCNLLRS